MKKQQEEGLRFTLHFVIEMVEIAEELGFDKDTAKKMAVQIIIGTISLMEKSTPMQIIDIVATKGGCTEVGLKVLKSGKGIKEAIRATYEYIKKMEEGG